MTHQNESNKLIKSTDGMYDTQWLKKPCMDEVTW